MTNEFKFSIDEGKSIKNFVFSESKFEIFNILEISNTKFILYGRDANQRGFVLGLDMEKIFPRLCKGEPDEADSDYYTWKVPSEGCIFGSKFSYRKKISEKECLNGDYFEKLLDMNYCKCTEEDWECDVGYSRNSDGVCI